MKIDDRDEIAKIDKQNVLGSVESLPDQCLHAWEDASKVEVSKAFGDINKIVFTGMGGSGLGARIIESLYANEIKCPLTRINDYHLPEWVDDKTLVVCSSYSGETEETIQTVREAISKKAKWMAIGAGNSLIEMARKNNAPYYDINPKFNPSNQPRMAICYSIVGQLVLISKAGVIKFEKQDVDLLVETMKSVQLEAGVENKDNRAKKLAAKMVGKIILFISSQHLVGGTHVVNNQLNENAKNFSMDFQIPELNHHLMEGLGFPETNKGGLLSILIDSDLYPDRIQKRLLLTEDVIRNNGIDTYVYKLKAKSKLAQVFELIQFGAYTGFYLSILYDKDPAPIPWVDYFKNKLGQPLGK